MTSTIHHCTAGHLASKAEDVCHMFYNVTLPETATAEPFRSGRRLSRRANRKPIHLPGLPQLKLNSAAGERPSLGHEPFTMATPNRDVAGLSNGSRCVW